MFVLPLSYPLPRRALRPAWNGSAQHLFDDTDSPQRPAMDAAESDTGYTLTFDLPGMSKQNVRVTIERREVRVEASQEAATATTNDGVRVLRRERHTPRFARTVQLPVEVDAAAATARFENGVLTVTLVKRAPETATVVNVQ